MNHPILLMLHVLFGMICLISALWVFIDTIHAAPAHQSRIRALSLTAALAMWAAFLIAGYWYIAYYGADKAIILKGPWPFAHNVFMETKEHFVIMLLLLITYLPIAAWSDLAANPASRRIVLWISGMAAALALLADGFGAIISMGVKVGLLTR